jgi:hypothetical protein
LSIPIGVHLTCEIARSRSQVFFSSCWCAWLRVGLAKHNLRSGMEDLQCCGVIFGSSTLTRSPMPPSLEPIHVPTALSTSAVAPHRCLPGLSGTAAPGQSGCTTVVQLPPPLSEHLDQGRLFGDFFEVLEGGTGDDAEVSTPQCSGKGFVTMLWGAWRRGARSAPALICTSACAALGAKPVANFEPILCTRVACDSGPLRLHGPLLPAIHPAPCSAPPPPSCFPSLPTFLAGSTSDNG